MVARKKHLCYHTIVIKIFWLLINYASLVNWYLCQTMKTAVAILLLLADSLSRWFSIEI